ncbi:MAG: glycine--tRNA ligase subunit alpha, partial [Caldilineaceae bacterium]|nr:glycine--tRNA ligase subunit alpha [Caldilineaceae bacterium]
YNFELADVERLKQLYEIYRAEADACLARGLVLPAHDYVLRQSQTFNLLDARGAIGVTERAKFFAGMRSQARRVSELYVQQRERAEFPWLKETADTRHETRDTGVVSNLQSPISAPQSFLLEIGSEELPPQDVVDGIAQIESKLAGLLAEYKLTYGALRVTGTTRRLVA